jgi:hypothetical protein
MASNLYDIRISLEADEEDARETALALVKVFSEHVSPIASASTIRETDRGVTVLFAEVPDQPPPGGHEFRPPREEDAHEAAGRAAIERLAESGTEATTLVPIVRALVSVSGARARAGLQPRQRVTIEVEPSTVHSQEELRHS